MYQLQSGPKIRDQTAYKSVWSGPVPVPQSGPVNLAECMASGTMAASAVACQS